VAGLKDERVKMIVKTKGEDNSLAQMVETAMQEECELKSQKFKNNTGQPWYQRKYERGGFERNQTPQIKREVNVTSKVECFRCQKPGHIAKHCKNPPHCSKCGKKGHEARQCRSGNGRREA
jgi:Arginine methyltransferase-interacting protein, contains RING Zn-finger